MTQVVDRKKEVKSIKVDDRTNMIIDIIDRATFLLAKGWCQKDIAMFISNGKKIPTGGFVVIRDEVSEIPIHLINEERRFCILGAIYVESIRCLGIDVENILTLSDEWSAVSTEVEREIDRTIKTDSKYTGIKSVIRFNDTPGRTKGEVLRLLQDTKNRLLRERSDKLVEMT